MNYIEGQGEGGDRECSRRRKMLSRRRGMEIMRDGRKVGISEEWRRRRGLQRES